MAIDGPVASQAPLLYARQEAWEAALSENDAIISAIATSLRDFRADNPSIGDGSFRDKIYEPDEHTIPWAKGIVKALEEAGFEIVKKDTAVA